MLMTLERAKLTIGQSIYLLPLAGAAIVFSFLAVASRFSPDWVANATTITACFLFIFVALGTFVRYKAEFSVQYEINSVILGYISLAVVMGGAASLLAADISGATEERATAFVIYELSIFVPLWFGVRNQLMNLGFIGGKSTEDWKKIFKGVVDFDRYIVNPDQSETPAPGRSPLASIWMWAPITVNLPLLFQIYTGSRNNAIFLAVPLLVGTFAYLSLKVLGPKIANLYVLRQYEKQTNRRFINADYEQIQELRRTFFLSRWLMKDYRPAASQQ